MIALRLLSLLFLVNFLTGCDVVDDVKKIKSDIKALKAYIMTMTPSNECQGPGTKQARICNYSLVVKKVDKDWYMGHVAPAVVEQGQADCKKTLDEIAKTDPDKKDFGCPDPKYYRYGWYGFKIEGDKPKENVAQDFVNIPNSEYLKLGKLDRIPLPGGV